MKIRRPLWKDGIVYGEPLLFTASGHADLAFAPDEILAVYNATAGTFFNDGLDYSWKPGSRRVTRSVFSNIPQLSDRELFPPEEDAIFFPTPGANAIRSGRPGVNILFSDGDMWSRHQVEVLYRTSDTLPLFDQAPGKLPRTRASKKLNIAATGDSITAGWNATKFVKSPPFMPSYIEQFAEAFQDMGTETELRNFAVGGTGSGHGAANLEEWLKDYTPDLLVIAFGMNEFSGPVQEFSGRVAGIMDIARKKNPDMEFILVSPFPRNPQWHPEHPPAPGRAMAESLAKLAEHDPAVAFADVNKYWNFWEGRKKFFDLTGNGVNHPNDFGHRLYATVLAELI